MEGLTRYKEEVLDIDMVKHYRIIRITDITKQNFMKRRDNLSRLFGKRIPMTKLLEFLSEQESIYPEDFASYIKIKKKRRI